MNFTVYTKDNCPYCSKIKQVLSGKGLNFVAYKLGVELSKSERGFFQKPHGVAESIGQTEGEIATVEGSLRRLFAKIVSEGNLAERELMVANLRLVVSVAKNTLDAGWRFSI